MMFEQKSDTEAPPQRGRAMRPTPGRASAFKPRVDITIDSHNIETPPRSRSNSLARAALRIPKYEDYARAAAAAPAASRTSGKLSSFRAPDADAPSARAPMRRSGRPGRNILVPP